MIADETLCEGIDHLFPSLQFNIELEKRIAKRYNDKKAAAKLAAQQEEAANLLTR